MASFRLPPQIWRLVVLAIGILGSYGVARVALTPATFGQYGHYRGAALEENAARDPLFAGAKSCHECHDDVGEKLGVADHRGLSCESCHGATRAHADDPDTHDASKPDRQVCLRCHAADVARPGWLKQIEPAEHFADDDCLECHLPHQPKETP